MFLGLDLWLLDDGAGDCAQLVNCRVGQLAFLPVWRALADDALNRGFARLQRHGFERRLWTESLGEVLECDGRVEHEFRLLARTEHLAVAEVDGAVLLNPRVELAFHPPERFLRGLQAVVRKPSLGWANHKLRRQVARHAVRVLRQPSQHLHLCRAVEARGAAGAPPADAVPLACVGRAACLVDACGDATEPLTELEQVERAVEGPLTQVRALSVAGRDDEPRLHRLAVGGADGARQGAHLRVVREVFVWREAGFQIEHMHDVVSLHDVVRRAGNLRGRLAVRAAEVVAQ